MDIIELQNRLETANKTINTLDETIQILKSDRIEILKSLDWIYRNVKSFGSNISKGNAEEVLNKFGDLLTK